MAEEPKKVNVQSRRVDQSILPNNFSLPYQLYIIQQSTDMQNIANASNEAGQLAYEATVKNLEQDVIIQDHESRIGALRIEVDDHEVRITSNSSSLTALTVRVTNAEGNITTITTDIGSVKGRLTTAEGNITDLQNNKASKSESLLKVDNLSGLADKAVSRTNLGLGDAAVKNTGTTAGTLAAGDDSRFSTVNGKSGGTISSPLTVAGRVAASGYACRTGTGGTTSGSSFNINWTSGGVAELWIDTTRIGTINITP